MFTCPRCRRHLERVDSPRGAQWRCPACEGRAVTIPVLRRMARADYVNQLWWAAKDLPRPGGGPPCPLCDNAMTVVQNLSASGDEKEAIHVDVCKCCHTVWFDTHELDHVLASVELPPERKEGPELSDRAKEVLALAEIERIRERADREDAVQGAPPAEGWQTILTVFGIPAEENVPALSRLPWVTWSVILLMAVATGWAQWGKEVIPSWGMIPNNSLRYGGLTFLTGFFLHSGWLHFFGNAAFLAVYGDNVEDYLGHIRFILLLAASSICGDLIHLVLDPNGSIPLVGASGGISGVIVFYALQFPKARLVYLLRIYLYFRWIRFSALTGLVLWVLLQGVGVWQQVSGFSNVSALAHLGGAAVGVLWWFATRQRENAAAVRGPLDPAG